MTSDSDFRFLIRRVRLEASKHFYYKGFQHKMGSRHSSTNRNVWVNPRETVVSFIGNLEAKFLWGCASLRLLVRALLFLYM